MVLTNEIELESNCNQLVVFVFNHGFCYAFKSLVSDSIVLNIKKFQCLSAADIFSKLQTPCYIDDIDIDVQILK